MSSSFKGYLPATTFVMAKRSLVKAASPEPTHLPASTLTSVVPIELIFVEYQFTLTGPSQDLLSKMIDAMGVKRASVWITDLSEFNESLPDFTGKVIVALGEDATKQILNSDLALQNHRAKVHPLPAENRVIATFHPAYLLENPHAKKDAWEDLKIAMRELGLSAK